MLHRQQFYLHELLTPDTPFRVAVWAETGGGEGPRVWRHTRTWPLRGSAKSGEWHKFIVGWHRSGSATVLRSAWTAFWLWFRRWHHFTVDSMAARRQWHHHGSLASNGRHLVCSQHIAGGHQRVDDERVDYTPANAVGVARTARRHRLLAGGNGTRRQYGSGDGDDGD